MKKLSVLLILMLALGVANGCGKKTTQAPKNQTNNQASQLNPNNNPHNVKFPPPSAQDKADIEASMKNFWNTLNAKDYAKLTTLIYKAKPDSTKGLQQNIEKNEVKTFEFQKLTGVTANNGLGAVGYVVFEQMGKGMETKYPDIGVLALIKDGGAWKVVLDKNSLTQQEVQILTNMVMQEQQNITKDPDYGKYQKQQQEFMVEAQATKQKFLQQTAPAPSSNGQKPPNHP